MEQGLRGIVAARDETGGGGVEHCSGLAGSDGGVEILKGRFVGVGFSCCVVAVVVVIVGEGTPAGVSKIRVLRACV